MSQEEYEYESCSEEDNIEGGELIGGKLPKRRARGGALKGGALKGGGYYRHAVRQGVTASGKRRTAQYVANEVSGQWVPSNYAKRLGPRDYLTRDVHPIKKSKLQAGVPARFVQMPIEELPMLRQRRARAPAGSYLASEVEFVPVGQGIVGGSMAQKEAAARNPWLKFLKKERAMAKREGYEFDMSVASQRYQAMKH